MRTNRSGLFGIAAAVLLVAQVASAGIKDSPLPTLSAGATTYHLYSVPGVVNDGPSFLATYFSCTSTSTSSIVVGVEVFGASGGGPLNNAATTAVTIPAGGSVRFGTNGSSTFSIDSLLGPGSVSVGSARILSTSKSLICTAFIADYTANPPASMTYLTIVAKAKQKAAN